MARLGFVSLVLFLVLVHHFFSFVFLVLKSYEVLGVARLGFYIFFDFLFSYVALHISMGPSHSAVLRIGGNPTEASSSGWIGGEFDSLAVVVHRVAPGYPSFPLDKGKGKINKI